MEEKVLAKGVFGGKFIPVIFYVLAAIVFCYSVITAATYGWDGTFIVFALIYALTSTAFGIIIGKLMKKRELIVTNKRVIVRNAFCFRTDFPIEKITSVSTRWFGRIGCGSSSMKIMLGLCKNKQEIFDTIASEMVKRDSAFLG